MLYNITKPTTVSGITPVEQEMIDDLWNVYTSKLTRNTLKHKYYHGKNLLKDLGISIPPPLRNIETVVGWPAKAVDYPAARSTFEGFVFDNGENKLLNDIIKRNRLKVLYKQATKSELTNSCMFWTIDRGIDGEQSVVISSYSALFAAALWDYRKKRIKCGMSVIDIDKHGKATWINIYTDDAILQLKRAGNNRFVCTRLPNEQGIPLMVPMMYNPSLDRPFGNSRISRAVISITDSAVRQALRTEVSSEFFTAPQRYVLGADDDLFKNKDGTEMPKYLAYMASFLAITANENGDIPQAGQFPQMSMQPHNDYMRLLASRFAGETNIPISSLGVIHDNPASAEAMYSAKEDLVIDVNDMNASNGEALETLGRLALAIAQDKTINDLTDEENSITAKFKNPATPSIVSQADGVVKIASAVPGFGETDVALEELGFNQEQIKRIKNDKRLVEGKRLTDQAVAEERARVATRQGQENG